MSMRVYFQIHASRIVEKYCMEAFQKALLTDATYCCYFALVTLKIKLIVL